MFAFLFNIFRYSGNENVTLEREIFDLGFTVIMEPSTSGKHNWSLVGFAVLRIMFEGSTEPSS